MAWLTLAQAPALGWGLDDKIQRTLLTLLVMAGVIAVGALLINLANRWRNRITQDDATGDQMMSFRELYERGDLSQEEYDRIKQRLSRRLRQELDLPAPNKPETPPQPPSPPAPPSLPTPNS